MHHRLLPLITLFTLAGCAPMAIPTAGTEAWARARAVSANAPRAEPVAAKEESDLEEDSQAIPRDVLGLPGEYEPVDRIIMGWHAGNWGYLDYFARVIREASADVEITIVVDDEDAEALAETLADAGVDLSRITFIDEPLDSMWMRDYGPLFVRTQGGGVRVIDLPYHADRTHDDLFPTVFALREDLPLSQAPLEMEGGHVQSDGTGRCIATDEVVRRNARHGFDEAEVRRLMDVYLGCREVSFLPALFAEETGHVDVFAYITGPGRVIVGRYDLRVDGVNGRRLNRAALRLQEAGFEVTRIPMPSNARRRTFRTHTNVLVTNRQVLVPVFRADRSAERRALRAFAEAFPGRRIVPIPADGVIGLAGALHCTTVTVPALDPRPRLDLPPLVRPAPPRRAVRRARS